MLKQDYYHYVVHVKKAPYDVYIGRPNPTVICDNCKWGNPFVIGKDGDREDVIIKYEQWLLSQPDLIKAVREELKDVLALVANSDEVPKATTPPARGSRTPKSPRGKPSPPSPTKVSPAPPPPATTKSTAPTIFGENDFPALSPRKR